MAILPNRPVERRILCLLALVNTLVGILGIYALTRSPILSFGPRDGFYLRGSSIGKIEEIALPETFFYRLPEFFTPGEESRWWRMQERVFATLSSRDTVWVEFTGQDGMTRRLEAWITNWSLPEAVSKVWLLYLSGLIYMVSAVSVFRRHRSVSASVLAFFLFFGALYFISSAPVVSRETTIAPPFFRILVLANYVASGGLITLVHFAFVFPRPKKMLESHPFLPYVVFYGYFLAVTALYLAGIFAFATSTPFLFFWTLIMIGAFIHSIATEKDRFLRKQVFLSFLAPLTVAVVFILFNILPGILGATSMRFVSFGLFSLILPFALPSALDNFHLYRQRIETERIFQRERERICRSLHDEIGSDLMSIRLLSEAACTFWDETEKAQGFIRDIRKTSQEDLERVREFLWAIDTGEESSEDLLTYFKSYSARLFSSVDIGIEFRDKTSSAPLNLSPSGRLNLFGIYKESMTNVVKHSGAKKVIVEFSVGKDGLEMKISDDGRGFDPEADRRGCYGLRNMRKRAIETGGTLHVSSTRGAGTEIRFHLPQKYLV